MTINKLIKEYTRLENQGYETIGLAKVLSDLRNIERDKKIKKADR